MDPQQRLLLEMSWETFENAGIQPSAVRGSKTGVYIGIATVDYSWRLAEDIAVVDASFATGNTSSIAANRLSYVFDLHGPSMAIDTACSSSLVAFHQACRAILSGEVTQALAGAVSLHLHPLAFVSVVQKRTNWESMFYDIKSFSVITRSLPSSLALRTTHSHRRPLAKLASLPPRNLNLPTVIQLNVKPAVDTGVDAANTFQVDDLLSIGAKKTLRIKLALEHRQRPPQQRPFLSPLNPDVVAFCSEHADFA